MFYIMTPSYNYGHFIGDAIDSVRLQGRDVVTRHHVQDGMSTDDTRLAVEKRSYSQLSYESQPDRGQCDALNIALEKLPRSASIVGWLNADEYYMPGALEFVRSVMDREKSIDIVYGNSLHVDAQGRLLRLVGQHSLTTNVLKHYGTFIQTASAFFRRELVDAGLLRFDVGLRQAMDLDVFLKLAVNGAQFRYVPAILSCFRIHNDQLTKTNGAAVAAGEYAALQERYGFSARRSYGVSVHRVKKLCEGSYGLERKVAREKGRQTRWFEVPDARARCEMLAGRR